MVKPLSRVQLVFVIMIGVGLLGERLTRREWLGVGIVVVGAAVLAIGPEAGAGVPPGPLARATIAGAGLCAVGGMLLAQRHWLRHLRPELALAIAAGVLFATSDLMKKVATEVVEHDHGSFAIWRADTLGPLLGTPDYLGSLVLGASSFAVLQMAYAHGRVSFIGPVGGIAEVMIAVVLGAVFLGEPLTAVRLLGIAVVLVGSGLLVTSKAPKRVLGRGRCLGVRSDAARRRRHGIAPTSPQ